MFSKPMLIVKSDGSNDDDKQRKTKNYKNYR